MNGAPRSTRTNEDQRIRLRKELTKVSRMLQELYEEGREEGDHARAVLVAEKLFRKGLSISEIMDITDLSEKELEEIRQRIQ